MIEQNLDREQTLSYQFDIIARDGDNQTGIQHIYVTIDDINDSAPKFERSTYIVRDVSENWPIGTVIIRVHADDDDAGVNSEINYYLVSSHENAFDIDSTTGEIRIVEPLDYETKNHYQLEVEARDNGEGSKTDYAT